jgi:O-antigen/teichoic acid export membrane protein
MQKKFLINLAFLILVNLLIKPFYILGIDAQIQNVVGAEDYGNYFAIFNFSFLFNMLNDLGTTNFNNRNIAQNEHLLGHYFQRIFSLRFLLFGGYAVVMLFSGLFIGYNVSQLYILGFLSLNQGLVAGVHYLRSNLSGLQLFKQDSIVSVLDRALLILFCGVLLWTDIAGKAFQIEWFVYAQTLSYFLTFLIAFLLVGRHLKSISLKWDLPFWMSILKQSIPFAVLILLLSLSQRLDTVILERIVPDGDVQSGIFAQGYRFLDALNNFSFLFAVLLFPMFSRMLKEREDPRALLDLSARILISGIGIIAITCYMFRVDIMAWRYVENIDVAAKCFGMMILTAVFHSTMHVYGALLIASGKLRSMNIAALIGVGFSVILNLWLAPVLLAYGSVIANFFSNGLIAVFYIAAVHKAFGFSISINLIIRLVLLLLVMIMVGLFAHFMPWTWITNAIVMVLIGLSVAMVLRLIDVKAVIGILKQS